MALSVLWIAHIAVAGVYILRLPALSGIRPPLRLVLLAGYLFSSVSVCWFYATDWVTFVVGWTMYPALVFYLHEAFGRTGRRAAGGAREAGARGGVPRC